MKRLILVMFLVFVVWAQDDNINGLGDTLRCGGVADTLKAGAVFNTAWIRLSAYEDLRVICKTDDTSSAGFVGDSINFKFGYQTGIICLNSMKVRDTCIDDSITIDTMSVDSFGVRNIGHVHADGTITRYWGGVDTTSVYGWAYKSRWLVPEWDGLIRFWVRGLAGSKVGRRTPVIFDVKRKVYLPVRMK